MKNTLIRILIPLIVLTVFVTAAAVSLVYYIGGGITAATGRAVAVCVFIAAASVAVGTAVLRRIVRPLDPDGENPDYAEYAPLLRRLGEQKRALKQSRASIEERERRLSTITENMTEGLVLLSGDGCVMFINSAAARFLGRDTGSCMGSNIVALGAQQRIQAAFHAAVGGSSSRENLAVGDRRIHVTANPVIVDGMAKGVVLMLVDVTERVKAEHMRREFSANVSHELKTPITSISGYAELMMNDMVRQEDVPELSGKIYREAQRLIALISDIIRLSRLDEEEEEQGPMVTVELLPAAAAVCELLEPKAAACSVSVELDGPGASVMGDARLIDEMLTNLVDNAIKYNRPGGHVWVTVSKKDGVPVLSVRDDGIGIAPEHLERIFERFYTVDRSRSRDTGGTGLGLSIVKHAAGYMRASVEAESVPEQGTRISIIFDGKGGNTK